MAGNEIGVAIAVLEGVMTTNTFYIAG